MKSRQQIYLESCELSQIDCVLYCDRKKASLSDIATENNVVAAATCSTHTSDITQEGNMLSIMTLDLRLVCFHMHNWLAGVKLKSTYTTCYCGLHIEMVTESMPLCDHFVWTQRHRKSETFRKIGEKKNHTFMSLSLSIYISLSYIRFGLDCVAIS